MQGAPGKDFFESIRRSVKISYFVASVIPLALLVYFSVKYVYPYVMSANGSELPLHIGALLILAVIISILGLFLSTKATNASISSLQSLYAKLNSLVEVTKQFRETLYLDILLESIVKSAMHLNSCEAGSLLLYDDTDNLRFKVLLGERNQTIKDMVVKRGEGISGWVAETGKSVLVNDTAKDKRFNPDFDRKSGFKTISVMCAPLVHNNEIIGVIEVLNKKNGIFTKEDEKLLHSLADQAAISIAQSKLHENRNSDIIHITEILVGAQDYHNPEKKGHARRVANYANLIGRQMELSEEDLRTLHYACLLHDIGLLKIDVSNQHIQEKYRQHPQLGYEMIKNISLWREAAELVINHHERYDGTGYPMAKKGELIPLGAKILSVANAFDVITSKHSYRKQLDCNEAISEIEANSGTQFDPAVVKTFKSSIKDVGLIDE
jgi:HD-GYP domain-containing protein (c-di-GMP phosphodiesterase class II)